jgi:hypothetical protein
MTWTRSTAWPPSREAIEWERCRRSPERFLRLHCSVYDAPSESWVPFDLWPAQAGVLAALHAERLVVALKARQLGFSWLALGEVLHHLLFRPGSTAVLFSKRDDEAVELLDFRLRGMHDRLPVHLQSRLPGRGGSSAHEWNLANGSRAMAFPTTGGRSYTASVAVIDEADFVPDLNSLLNAVKPTVHLRQVTPRQPVQADLPGRASRDQRIHGRLPRLAGQARPGRRLVQSPEGRHPRPHRSPRRPPR